MNGKFYLFERVSNIEQIELQKSHLWPVSTSAIQNLIQQHMNDQGTVFLPQIPLELIYS